LAATVCGIVAIVILLASFFMSWYLWEITMDIDYIGVEGEIVMEFDMNLDEVEMRGDTELSANGAHFSNSTQESTDWDDEEDDEISETYINTRNIMTIAIILGVLALIFIIIVGAMGGADPTLRKLPQILGVLAILFTLMAAAYFMVNHPKAWENEMKEDESDSEYVQFFNDTGGPQDSFWGSKNEEINFVGIPADAKSEWQPQIGWYLTFVASALLGLTIVLHRIAVIDDDISESMRRRRYGGARGPGPYPYQTSGQPRAGPPGYDQGHSPVGPGYSEGVGAYAPIHDEPAHTYVETSVPYHEEIEEKPETSYSCPTCGQDIRFIEQYERWWCDSCYKYI
jgi:hypothetical protein